MKGKPAAHLPSLVDMMKFAAVCGITLLVALLAGAGRVAYTLIMLLIAGALAYAAVDLVDCEIVKKKRPRLGDDEAGTAGPGSSVS